MIRSDFHVHTAFSDGKNTPEEMVIAAMEKGMDAIGFSDHSYTFFDESYCIPKDRISEYQQAIRSLQQKYAGKIRILCGIEQDLYSNTSTDGYDYVIGSVHYLHLGEEFVPVDESPEILLAAAQRHFGGDMVLLAESYFRTAALLAERPEVTIIGHLDLIRKFNRGGVLFSEKDPRYISAARRAADVLLASGKLFEINTGAMSRGYLPDPYPASDLMAYITGRDGKWIASSDSHRTDTLCAYFDTISPPTVTL